MAIADWSRDARGGRACGAEPGGRKEGPILDRTGSFPSRGNREREGGGPFLSPPSLGDSRVCVLQDREPRGQTVFPTTQQRSNASGKTQRTNPPSVEGKRTVAAPRRPPEGGILRGTRTSSPRPTVVGLPLSLPKGPRLRRGSIRGIHPSRDVFAGPRGKDRSQGSMRRRGSGRRGAVDPYDGSSNRVALVNPKGRARRCTCSTCYTILATAFASVRGALPCHDRTCTRIRSWNGWKDDLLGNTEDLGPPPTANPSPREGFGTRKRYLCQAQRAKRRGAAVHTTARCAGRFET